MKFYSILEKMELSEYEFVIMTFSLTILLLFQLFNKILLELVGNIRLSIEAVGRAQEVATRSLEEAHSRFVQEFSAKWAQEMPRYEQEVTPETQVDKYEKVNSSDEANGFVNEDTVDSFEYENSDISETAKKRDSFIKDDQESSNSDDWDTDNYWYFMKRPLMEDPKPEVSVITDSLDDLNCQFPNEVQLLKELTERIDGLDERFKVLKGATLES